MMDRSTGKIIDLMPELTDWVDEFTWAPDSSFILFASPHQGEEQIRLVATDEEVPGSGKYAVGTRPESGEFSDLRVTPNAGIVAVRMTVDHPSDVVRIPRQTYDTNGTMVGGHEMFALTHDNEALMAQLDLSKMEAFWFAGANGTKVEGFVVRPPNFDAGKKYPVKYLLHGGPQTAWGDAWSYRWNAELFAADGYVVVMVNRRGSTGYGQKFVDGVGGGGLGGGGPYVDLMKGLDYAEAKFPFIDKNRECALGASYGGFMADWVLTHTDRFKCIVTHDGMYNPQSAFGTTEELWFNEWEFRPLVGAGPDAVVEQTKPAHPWDFYDRPASEDPFRKWSPMMFIKDARTPTLVIHSQLDYRLDLSEGLQLFTALQLLGVPSEMLSFPDEGHWILKPQNSQLWNETVSDWCDRWTGTNKYAAVGPERNPKAKSVAAKSAAVKSEKR
jgi:dipeptidyl aminopeptidase/acylaminoacyl peptidase